MGLCLGKSQSKYTGRYYEPVAQVIHDRGLSVSAVNPLLIKEYGGNSLRRVKTGKADAKKIARYGLDNRAELREYTPMDTMVNAAGTKYAKIAWACATYTHRGKSECPAKRIPEDILKAKCAEALGLAAYDRVVFKAKVAAIAVSDDGVLVFRIRIHREKCR